MFFEHEDGRTTVVPIHNRELSKGLLRKILYDVKLSVEDYEKLRKKKGANSWPSGPERYSPFYTKENPYSQYKVASGV